MRIHWRSATPRRFYSLIPPILPLSTRGSLTLRQPSLATLLACAPELTVENCPITHVTRFFDTWQLARKFGDIAEKWQRVGSAKLTAVMFFVTNVHHARILATTVYLYNSLVISRRTYIHRFSGQS